MFSSRLATEVSERRWFEISQQRPGVTERFRRSLLWACENFSDLTQVRRTYRCSSGYLYAALYRLLELERRQRRYPWPRIVQIDTDCVSGHCLTYYVDADGDGCGSSEQGHFCEELSAPAPARYAAYAGDCCDLDAGANPAFNTSEYPQMPDACGSFDWNCDGILEMQNPTCPGETVECGQPCYLTLGGFIDTSEPPVFVEACH